MARLLLPVLCVAALSVATSAVAQSDINPPVTQWVAEPGGVGQTLADGAFVVRKGVVRTARVYSDFVLHFEFRPLDAGAAGALFVRARFGYGARSSEYGYRIDLSEARAGGTLGRVTPRDVSFTSVEFTAVGSGLPIDGWRECDVRAERDELVVVIDGAIVSPCATSAVSARAVRSRRAAC
jgi:hypothetical protein